MPNMLDSLFSKKEKSPSEYQKRSQQFDKNPTTSSNQPQVTITKEKQQPKVKYNPDNPVKMPDSFNDISHKPIDTDRAKRLNAKCDLALATVIDKQLSANHKKLEDRKTELTNKLALEKALKGDIDKKKSKANIKELNQAIKQTKKEIKLNESESKRSKRKLNKAKENHADIEAGEEPITRKEVDSYLQEYAYTMKLTVGQMNSVKGTLLSPKEITYNINRDVKSTPPEKAKFTKLQMATREQSVARPSNPDMAVESLSREQLQLITNKCAIAMEEVKHTNLESQKDRLSYAMGNIERQTNLQKAKQKQFKGDKTAQKEVKEALKGLKEQESQVKKDIKQTKKDITKSEKTLNNHQKKADRLEGTNKSTISQSDVDRFLPEYAAMMKLNIGEMQDMREVLKKPEFSIEESKQQETVQEQAKEQIRANTLLKQEQERRAEPVERSKSAPEGLKGLDKGQTQTIVEKCRVETRKANKEELNVKKDGLDKKVDLLNKQIELQQAKKEQFKGDKVAQEEVKREIESLKREKQDTQKEIKKNDKMIKNTGNRLKQSEKRYNNLSEKHGKPSKEDVASYMEEYAVKTKMKTGVFEDIETSLQKEFGDDFQVKRSVQTTEKATARNVNEQEQKKSNVSAGKEPKPVAKASTDNKQQQVANEKTNGNPDPKVPEQLVRSTEELQDQLKVIREEEAGIGADNLPPVDRASQVSIEDKELEDRVASLKDWGTQKGVITEPDPVELKPSLTDIKGFKEQIAETKAEEAKSPDKVQGVQTSVAVSAEDKDIEARMAALTEWGVKKGIVKQNPETLIEKDNQQPESNPKPVEQSQNVSNQGDIDKSIEQRLANLKSSSIDQEAEQAKSVVASGFDKTDKDTLRSISGTMRSSMTNGTKSGSHIPISGDKAADRNNNDKQR